MKNKRLIKTIGFTLLLIMVVEIGKKLTLPGMAVVSRPTSHSPILHFLSATTGGNLLTPTLLSLGMGPYMTSLILWSTISLIDIDPIANLSQRQQGTIMRVLTLIFAFLQSFILAMTFHSLIKASANLINFSYTGAMAAMILFLTTGGMIVAWFADLNMEKGVGMQMIFYMPGIVEGIIAMLVTGQTSLNSTGSFHWQFTLLMLLFTVAFIFLTLFFFNAERRIPLQRVGIESKLNDSYIPIRMLNAGVMPFMFTTSIFQIPTLFLNNSRFTQTYWGHLLQTIFSLKTLPGVITYGVIFFGLSMGFSYVNVRPHDLAKNLKESGDYILDIRPGHDTEHYLNSMMTKIGLIGNTYLLLTSIVPLLISLRLAWVQQISFYSGSVFFLIVIADGANQSIKFIRDLDRYTIFE